VSNDRIEKTIDGVVCLHWSNVFREIGIDQVIDSI
jgi:hypothetical protein